MLDQLSLALNKEEFLMLNDLLNEAAHGIPHRFLDELITNNKHIFEKILFQIHQEYNKNTTSFNLSISPQELELIIYTFPFVIKYLGPEEIHPRMGVEIEEAEVFCSKLKNILQNLQI